MNYVEQELAATKGRESALQERLLKELDGYQERYRDQVKKIAELEVYKSFLLANEFHLVAMMTIWSHITFLCNFSYLCLSVDTTNHRLAGAAGSTQ